MDEFLKACFAQMSDATVRKLKQEALDSRLFSLAASCLAELALREQIELQELARRPKSVS